MAELDVIIPACNEEGNIAKLTDRLVKSLNSAGIDYRLIFVDDYSDDGTINEVVKSAENYSSSKK